MTYIGKFDPQEALVSMIETARWDVEPPRPSDKGWRSWRLTSAVAYGLVRVLSWLPGKCAEACCESRWALWRALREFTDVP